MLPWLFWLQCLGIVVRVLGLFCMCMWLAGRGFVRVVWLFALRWNSFFASLFQRVLVFKCSMVGFIMPFTGKVHKLSGLRYAATLALGKDCSSLI